jgi:DNA-binding NarL/FixJ family response regulator
MVVGVVSKHALIRRALVALLSGTGDMRVGWEVADIRSLDRTEAPPASVDLIVVEADCDIVDHVLFHELKSHFATARIAVIYENPSDELVKETLLAGAHGCFSKSQDGGTFLKALGCINRGELWAQRRIMSSLFEKGMKSDGQMPTKSNQLTRREWEVFSLIAVGKRNRQIAAALCISEATVKRHVYSIFQKLQVPSRLEAGLLFYRMTPAARISGSAPSSLKAHVAAADRPGLTDGTGWAHSVLPAKA